VKLALLAVSALLALCIAGLVVVVIAGREQESLAVDNLLAERLSLEVARSDVLRLADVAPFPWDTVLVVEHGAPEEAIEAEIDEEWTGGLNFGTNDLLVFVRDGRVARYADYRGEGRFDGVERPVAVFGRDDAVFEIDDLVITPR
jgi:hypothetical protein